MLKPTMTTPLPDNLTDDDRLLLHWSGELPEADAAAVAARLDADAGASRELRAAFAAVDERLTNDARAAGRAGGSAAASARSVAAALRAATSAPPPAVRRPRFSRPPTWALYPAAAAALLMLGMLGWFYTVRNEGAQAFVDPSPGDPGPAVLILPGEPDKDAGQASDDQIAAQFNSMIVFERGAGVEWHLAAIEFLESEIQ